MSIVINALRGFKPRLRSIACPSPRLQYQCPTINVEIDNVDFGLRKET